MVLGTLLAHYWQFQETQQNKDMTIKIRLRLPGADYLPRTKSFPNLSLSIRWGLPVGWQSVNGSPVYPLMQLQNGLWLTTLHLALRPQVPGHGSRHFWFKQARCGAHSELDVHSGLHVGGLPTYPWIQAQIACWLTSWHWLFGPQGDGWQGFVITGSERDSVE